MCSSPFNVTRMFLNSFVTCDLGLVILFHLLVNCLRVDWLDCLYVCRVCFDCVSHQRCTVGLYCASSVSEWSCFQREKKKGFFHFFLKKMEKNSKKKWPDVRPDERLTSVDRRQPHPTWRSDVRHDNQVKRRLSWGSERGVVSSCWETSSWERGLGLAPTLTCDWSGAQTSLQSYWVRSLTWMSHVRTSIRF
jgi:hypothetical protein